MRESPPRCLPANWTRLAGWLRQGGIVAWEPSDRYASASAFTRFFELFSTRTGTKSRTRLPS